MKQAIEFNHYHAKTMIIGARKKQPFASYVFVHKGSALIRLGKHELPLCTNQGFWLPMECLNAMTVLKGSEVSTLNFSVRSIASLPTQAGFVESSSLMKGIVEQLVQYQKRDQQQWDSPHGRLLRCARDYLSIVTPTDNKSNVFRQLLGSLDALNNGHALNDTQRDELKRALGISDDDIAIQLRVREWVRLHKSGRSFAKIAADVGLSESEVGQLLEHVAGVS
ncbi:hypothetical protein L4D06_08780 [Enterovibrio makurazakiensis]|uniref:AraC family transcriptional regulator n=1 Tax=Enterovibrio gelatinilyticus TaxID=2899819 RepID=A0ABT5QW79_9GAMM|nr:hypothetical protein [Enterovibrio sp. ZSDZ42]MDD1792268.1 hypothetical protein [Enterovibrio sp. ZSDZ42]